MALKRKPATRSVAPRTATRSVAPRTATRSVAPRTATRSIAPRTVRTYDERLKRYDPNDSRYDLFDLELRADDVEITESANPSDKRGRIKMYVPRSALIMEAYAGGYGDNDDSVNRVFLDLGFDSVSRGTWISASFFNFNRVGRDVGLTLIDSFKYYVHQMDEAGDYFIADVLTGHELAMVLCATGLGECPSRLSPAKWEKVQDYLNREGFGDETADEFETEEIAE